MEEVQRLPPGLQKSKIHDRSGTLTGLVFCEAHTLFTRQWEQTTFDPTGYLPPTTLTSSTPEIKLYQFTPKYSTRVLTAEHIPFLW